MNELILVNKPNSPFSEEIKKVRTNLMFSLLNENSKVIMLTSSLPGEGKSFVSANLAVAFAQAGEKVLLIDCDLRKGRTKKIFKIPPKIDGLSNLLIDKVWSVTYDDYIQKTNIEKLDVIVSGSYPPNPSELLASDRFKELVNKLRDNYDIILLDCPPVTGLNDALVIANQADISILVAKYKSTSMEILEKSKKELENVGAKIAGVILNQTNSNNKKYYYYGGYYKD